MRKNDYPTNPIVDLDNSDYMIMFKQDKSSLLDADIYERYIYSITRSFYNSRFYKNYKNYIMNLGMTRSGMMANITSEMIGDRMVLHHQLPTLKQATIMITEHLINTQGYANTFEVLQLLEESHRNHEIAVIIMDDTNHRIFHSSPSSFISLSQCWGRPDKFIEKYIDGMTFDISMKFLLAIKQEYQYNGESNTPMMAKVRDEILDWQTLNGYRTQTGGIFVPFNQNYNTQQYGYGYPQQQLLFF